MKKRVIILCQGSQARLPELSRPKHLLPFNALSGSNGFTILERTVVQVQESGISDIHVIAEGKMFELAMAIHGLKIAPEPNRHPDQDFLDIFEHLKHLYLGIDQLTVILYGDVIFSNRSLKKLLDPYFEDDAAPVFLTRMTSHPITDRRRAEIYGFAFTPSFHREFEAFLSVRKLSPYHDAKDIWDLLHHLVGKKRVTCYEVGEDDFTHDIDYPDDLKVLPVLEMLAREEKC